LLGPRAPRDLRVDGLVAPVRRPLDEIREPTPVSVDEDGLIDDRRVGAHRLLGPARGTVPVEVRPELDLLDVGPERVEVSELMLRTFCGSAQPEGCAGRVAAAPRARRG